MFPWGMFPFNNDELKQIADKMNPADIQSYISEMIKKYIPSNTENSGNPFPFQSNPASFQPKSESSIHPDVFETFDHIFIRIQLPNEEIHKQIKIFHTSNQAIIENFPEPGKRHTIILPSLVKRKGATALVKDQILEIKIPKMDDMQLTEVDVSERL
jgi:HSP20 family molecular chaperone IbpA